MTPEVETLIVGSGPTGLGAAWRLAEHGAADWRLVEACAEPGGTASSHQDVRGYTWDLGGHVTYSHSDTYDRVLDAALPAEDWLHHQRRAAVHLAGRDVPCPLQHNLHHLDPVERLAILRELAAPRAGTPAANFADRCTAAFGPHLTERFFRPYNEKLFRCPLEALSDSWADSFVAPLSFDEALRTVVLGEGREDWGPNATFRYPRQGGAGALWKAVAAALPAERLRFGTPLVALDPERRVADLDGRPIRYRQLVITAPLTRVARLAGLDDAATRGLRATATVVLGLGLPGDPPPELAGRTWLYFPGAEPFHRVTVLSRYSPHSCPPGHWSLLLEQSLEGGRDVDEGAIVERAVRAVEHWLGTSITPDAVFFRLLRHGYPVPTVERDDTVRRLVAWLEARSIFPRGRFGLWRYERSNQDDAFLQGVEVVDRLTRGATETTAFGQRRVGGDGRVQR